MRLFCIDDYVPAETLDQLRVACEERDVQLMEIHAPTFRPGAQPAPAAGDLLYRPAVSLAASRVEQSLARRDLATFYRSFEAVFFECTLSPLYHERCGLPIPKTIVTSTTDRRALRENVQRLGGLPLVAKVLGGDGGVGVILIESLSALFSTMDYVVGRGGHPLLSEYIGDAVHWRLIVLGDRVLTAYRNVRNADDFRTYASEAPEDYGLEPTREMAELAVRAVRTLDLEFGGVDVLEDPAGGLFLLEANFPCYFGHPLEVAGIDVAGPMVDHLLEKSRRILSSVPAPAASIADAPAAEPERRFPQDAAEALAVAPRLYWARGFASEAEVRHVLAVADDLDALRARGVEVHHDRTGTSCELPIDGDPLLVEIARRIYDLAGIDNDLGDTFRFRRYEPGDGHPLHTDNFEIDELHLVATALLYLTDASDGGETHFPNARPSPVSIRPQRGCLALWFNYDRDGHPEEASLHESTELRAGEKCTIASFLYKPLTALADVPWLQRDVETVATR